MTNACRMDYRLPQIMMTMVHPARMHEGMRLTTFVEVMYASVSQGQEQVWPRELEIRREARMGGVHVATRLNKQRAKRVAVAKTTAMKTSSLLHLDTIYSVDHGYWTPFRSALTNYSSIRIGTLSSAKV